MADEVKVQNAPIDEEVMDIARKEQIDLGMSSVEQMRRCEINFYAELLSQMKKANDGLEKLYETLNMIGSKQLTEYFKEFSSNWQEEEAREKTLATIARSHMKKKKKKKDSPVTE